MNVAKIAAAPMLRRIGRRLPISAQVNPKNANTTIAIEISGPMAPVTTRPTISTAMRTYTGSGMMPMRYSMSLHQPSGQKRLDGIEGCGTWASAVFAMNVSLCRGVAFAFPNRLVRSPMAQRRIPAVYMRGGTSKGVFFVATDLPAAAALRDRILLRVIGSPDRYGKHIDGMGGATSSTSKVVLVAKSAREDSDVDYLFGAVAIDRPVIDWSGNCGNLTAAVAPFAIHAGLVEP